MKFHSPKKFWEIQKNVIKTTEAIGSIPIWGQHIRKFLSKDTYYSEIYAGHLGNFKRNILLFLLPN